MRVLRIAALSVFLLTLSISASTPAFAITTPTPAASPTAQSPTDLPPTEIPPTDVPATRTPRPPTNTASPTNTAAPSATPTPLPTLTRTPRATNTARPSLTASPAPTETVFQPQATGVEATASALAATAEPTETRQTPTADGSGEATALPSTESLTRAPTVLSATPAVEPTDQPESTRSPAILTEVESGGGGGQTLLVAILIALGLAVIGVSQATRRK